VFLGTLTAADLASAVSIPISNAGFEDPALADGTNTTNTVPGWSGIGSSFGVFDPDTSFFTSIPEGENVLFIENGEVFQTLTSVLASGLYELTVQVGDSLQDPDSPFTVQLRAGSTILASATGPDPANGLFTTVTVTYTAGALDPALGQALEIRLIDNEASFTTEPYFDAVRLEFTAVPEPSAVLLLGAGILATGAARLWRRRLHQR
jgi:hypothetical protein